MHDEPQIGLVESHAQRRRRDQCLDPVVQQVVLEHLPLGGVGLPGVRGDLVTAVGQQTRQVAGSGDGERVDDAGPGELVEVLGQPRRALGGLRDADDRHAQRVAFEGAPQHQRLGAAHSELRGDVGDDAVVRGGRRGQDRDALAEFFDQGPDAAVVRPEVVAPVRDAMGLVDHDEAGIRGEGRQHLVAEVGVVESLGADQQYIEFAGGHPFVDLVPLGDVSRVDRRRPHTGPFGRGDLVAHQGQQRGDDDGRAVPGARSSFAAMK